MKPMRLKLLSESGFKAGALTVDDQVLITAAEKVLQRHYRPFWHTVGAAIRGKNGRIWTGLHIGTTVGRLAVCAEAVALGRSILEGDGTIDTIVAVRHPKPEEPDLDISIVSPCGACREMILDHAPDAWVLLRDKSSWTKAPIGTLLPWPYRR